MSNNKFKFIFSFFLVGLVFFVFRNYLFGDRLFVFSDIGSDSINSFYPKLLEKLYLKSYGWIDTWSFMRGIGKNVYDSGLLDPTSFPFNFLGIEGLSSYIVWRQVIRILLSGFFIYKYFELKKFDQKTTSLITLLFIFSGYMVVSSSWYGHTYFILNFSLAMYSFELLIRKGICWPFGIAIALFFNFNLVFFIEFLVLYSLIAVAENVELFKNKEFLKKLFTNFSKAFLLIILLIAPFAGNIIYRFIYSPRILSDETNDSFFNATGIFSTEETSHYYTAILRFFSPDILGNALTYKGWYNFLEAPVFYAGIPTLLLLYSGLKAMTPLVRKAHFLILFIWTIIVIFPFFRYGFYGFSGSYYKFGLNLFIPFTFLHIAAYGIESNFSSPKIERSIFVQALILSIILTGAYWFYPEHINKKICSLVFLFIWIYTILLFLVKNIHFRYFLLILIAASEVVYFANNVINDRTFMTKSSINDSLSNMFYTRKAVDYLQAQDSSFYRIEKPYYAFQYGWNDAPGLGYYSTGSYDSHNHKNYLQFLKKYHASSDIHNLKSSKYIDGILQYPILHPFFSVKYYLLTNDYKNKLSPVKTNLMHHISILKLYRNENFIPFGIPLSKYFTEAEFDKIKERENLHMSLYEGVVIENQDLPKAAGTQETFKSQIKNVDKLDSLSQSLNQSAFKADKFYNDYITGTINVSAKSVLVFTMPFDAGWNFYDNGAKVQPIRVNHGLTGLIIEPGLHQIKMIYLPPFFYQGWVLFLIGFIWIIVTIFTSIRSKTHVTS